jgi:hypothetical protein
MPTDGFGTALLVESAWGGSLRTSLGVEVYDQAIEQFGGA